jgi:hypothetical protein
VSITLLASLEWLARAILLDELTNPHSPRAKAIHSDKEAQDVPAYPKIDPILGWAGEGDKTRHQELKFNESAVILESKLPDPKKILILGGSTSDLYYNLKSWPYHLALIFEKKGMPVEIHVGAVAGYTSHQELLKMVRDARLESYDLILSYTGVNEAVSRRNEYPFTTFYTQYFFHRSIPPSKLFFGISSLLQKWTTRIQLSFGPKDKLTIIERFLTNVKSSHALSKVYGAQYLAILQPYLTSGNRALSKNEKKLLNDPIIKDLVETNKNFYSESRTSAKDIDFLYDGTDFLDPLKEAYYDDCHTNQQGTQHIANRIALLINEKKLLK